MRKKPKYKPNRENGYADVARQYNEANPDDFISDEIAQQIGNRAMRKIRLALLLDGKDIEHSGLVFKISDMPRH
jgi:hypothetical protein